jgi:hypothetical protein
MVDEVGVDDLLKRRAGYAAFAAFAPALPPPIVRERREGLVNTDSATLVTVRSREMVRWGSLFFERLVSPSRGWRCR